jgi:hypothetical protein
MNLANDSYVILIGTKSFTERYFRDKSGWLKVSARGRTFRMTAEQVLNHVLPAVAGIKPKVSIKVEHHEPPVPARARRRTSRVERAGGSRPAQGAKRTSAAAGSRRLP